MHNVPHSQATKDRLAVVKTGVPVLKNRRPSITVDGVVLWRCARCEGFFHVPDFPRNNRTVLGIKNECRKCHSKTAMRSRDPEKRRANGIRHARQRRARLAGGDGFRFVGDDEALFWSIVGRACLKCGAAGPIQIDHVVPLSRGGVDHPSNFQPLCPTCNFKKHAMTAEYRSSEQIAQIAAIWVYTFEAKK